MDPKCVQNGFEMTNFDQHEASLGGTDCLVDLTLRLGIQSSNKNIDQQSHTANDSSTSQAVDRSSLNNPNVNGYKQYEFPAPPELKNYCIINISNRRGKTGGSRKRKTTGRGPAKVGDNNKTCTNYNCRVTESPMWRTGPLGPKSLCNRCGIRFRKIKQKEETEQQAAEAAFKQLHAVSKL
ncbi:GATA transcription factor 29-like [Prunus avium]|uniref:GATA transcription factor 29-like n=1 Tax=Prunus avium TaxID=42229 RepID=A0A6P5T3D2_PRUAV|nr:GATA transcription factor 29-like [Prunus avium]